jgi:Protein of unknown function (DUF3984)
LAITCITLAADQSGQRLAFSAACIYPASSSTAFSLATKTSLPSLSAGTAKPMASNMEDLSRASSGGGSRTPRRSFPNLTHLSLAPLSSRFPIDDEGYEEPDVDNQQLRSSYIQGKSAPSTPGILKSSNKPHRKHVKTTSYAHESYFPPTGSSLQIPMTKAKSVGAMAPQFMNLGMSEDVRISKTKRIVVHNNDEWLYRAGLTLTNEAREVKGQSWLVSRESSTSLVQHGEVEHDEEEDESPHSSRGPSRRVSRAGSRVNSARPSRRSSRVGSRLSFITPAEPRTPGLMTEGFFTEEVIEADFVEPEDEESTAVEAEVRQLSSIRGFGVGGLIDRIVGFPLFETDDDSEDEDPKKTEEESAEEALKRKQLRLKQRKELLAKAASSSATATSRREVIEPPKQDEDGGWKDVAWLLSVASKVVL